MVKVQDVASVNFQLAAPVFSTGDSFSIPLLITTEAPIGSGSDPRLNTYSDLDGVEYDYPNTTDTYAWAAAFFAQEGKESGASPNLLKIGFRQATQNCIWSVTWNADATAGTFKIGVAGTDSGTIAWNADAATIKAAIDAISGVASVTVTLRGANASKKEGFTIEFSGDAGINFPTVTADVTSLTSVTTATLTKTQVGHTPELYATAYAAIKAKTQDFYFVLLLLRVSALADIDTLATVIKTEDRELWLCSDNVACKQSGGGVALEVKTLALGNTLVMAHYTADEYLDAAELGATITDFFGSTNPCYYELTLITADTYTSSEVTYLNTNRCNRCELLANVTCIQGTSAGQPGNEGLIMGDGRFAYQVWSKHYLEAMCSEALVNLLLASKKIAFNVTDFNKVKSTILNTMITEGEERGLLVEKSSDVTMPALIGYNPTKKSQAWLDGIKATSNIEDIINKISVTGTLA